MKGKYTYELKLSIGFPRAVREETLHVSGLGYEPEEWDAISQEQREHELNTYLEEWSQGFIKTSWE